jgi:hypothetical protein
MSDPLRTEGRAPDAGPNSDRDAKIEQLLLAGLDHYFANEYEQAVNVWTRVLFLDRGHARARAYIERARSALAERQREGEELLHNGLDAFARGEAGEARRLLDAAVAHGASADLAFGVLDRLQRLEPAPLPAHEPEVYLRERAPIVSPPAPHRGRRSAAVWVVLAAALAAAGIGLVTRRSSWPSRSSLLSLFRQETPPAAPPLVLSEPDPVLPRHGETALARARAHAVGGHFWEALGALDLIAPTDPQYGDAQQLRVSLQWQLLDIAPAGGLPTTAERPRASVK